MLSSGGDEKLHIKLSSETLENLDSMFKIKPDDSKNKFDVICLNKNKLSRYEAEESLTVEIILPNKYSDHCEIVASVKLLAIRNLHLNRLEYDGGAEQVYRINNSIKYDVCDYGGFVKSPVGNQFSDKFVLYCVERWILEEIPAKMLCRILSRYAKSVIF